MEDDFKMLDEVVMKFQRAEESMRDYEELISQNAEHINQQVFEDGETRTEITTGPSPVLTTEEREALGGYFVDSE